METPDDFSALPKHHQATHSEKLIITASSLGTVFEWYDFYLYGLLTAIIAAKFLTGLNETTSFIMALLVFAQPMVATLYHRGAFTPEAVQQTTAAVMGYGAGLIGLVGLKVVTPGYFARQDMKTPVKVAIVVLLLTQVMNAVFVPTLGVAGLSLSIGLAAVLNAGWLLRGLHRRYPASLTGRGHATAGEPARLQGGPARRQHFEDLRACRLLRDDGVRQRARLHRACRRPPSGPGRQLQPLHRDLHHARHRRAERERLHLRGEDRRARSALSQRQLERRFVGIGDRGGRAAPRGAARRCH